MDIVLTRALWVAVLTALCSGCGGPGNVPYSASPGSAFVRSPDVSLCGEKACDSIAQMDAANPGPLEHVHDVCSGALAKIPVGFLDGRSYFPDGTFALGLASDRDFVPLLFFRDKSSAFQCQFRSGKADRAIRKFSDGRFVPIR